MAQDNGYQHDVFLSYHRASDWPMFVQNHFLPMLRHWLAAALGRDPNIYDYQANADASELWPQLHAALARSKVMLCLFSKAYFSDHWCMTELSQMLARQEFMISDSPPTLVVGAVIHGDVPAYPDVAHMQLFNLQEYANPWMAHGSATKERLSEQVSTLSLSLADTIMRAPAHDSSWLDLNNLPYELLSPLIYSSRGAGRNNLREYVRQARKEARPLNEAKLILLGWGGVGKTSLVNRLVHQRFDPSQPQTDGLQVTSWTITDPSNESVRLNVWDFGGQDIMHATHKFFLTSRSLYLVVLNGRPGRADADADYWLRIIKSFGADSPAIIVLNKIADNPFDLDEAALASSYPNIRGFIKTDCAAGESGVGLDKLLAAISDATGKLVGLRSIFPATWFEIKNRLATMTEDYLTFERYREICADYGESDRQAQEQLADSLHALGIVLNYRGDARLRDTHVLNPRWVTEGIYAILNSSVVVRQHGEFSESDLPDILDTERYPPERYLFLIDLMRRFELCFAYDDEPAKYLAADLLPKQQPDAAVDFPTEDSLRFEYRYSVLREELIPHFIVRSHVNSKREPRWRKGALLRWEQNYALIQADFPTRMVRIFVTGPAEGRRRLLAIIRADFEHIHRSYGPDISAFVPVPGHPGLAVEYDKLLAAETEGIRTLQEYFAGRFINVEVAELLAGVALRTLGKDPGLPATDSRRPVRMFVSYSHRDERHRETFENHLKILSNAGLLSVWHDRRIDPGDDWKGKIDEALEEADLVVLLVSVNFLSSRYCNDVEVKRALERRAEGSCQVVPVLVGDARWKLSPLSELQALPVNGRPITTWRNRDTAWRVVAEGLERVIGTLQP